MLFVVFYDTNCFHIQFFQRMFELHVVQKRIANLLSGHTLGGYVVNNFFSKLFNSVRWENEKKL